MMLGSDFGPVTLNDLSTMLPAHSKRISYCLAHAAEAERLSAGESDPTARADLLALAENWRQVAAKYEQIDKLERFLETHRPPNRPSREH